jgi:hypothetical protein
MKSQGIFAKLIAKRLHLASQRLGLNVARKKLDTLIFSPPDHNKESGREKQLELF